MYILCNKSGEYVAPPKCCYTACCKNYKTYVANIRNAKVYLTYQAARNALYMNEYVVELH